MKTIIFVCHGSICRSPAAAFIAKKYLKEIGRDSEFNILIRATSSEEIGNDVALMRILNSLSLPISFKYCFAIKAAAGLRHIDP